MAKLKSPMKHQFSEIPRANIPRSSFNRSHGFKTTFDAGYLVPIFVDEALPGDTMNLRMQAFARLATPIHPFMDNLYLSTFFFAVPVRLIWDNWQKFMGEQDNPGDSTDYQIPQMTAPASTGHAIGSLADYFGIPTGVAELKHSSLWHRAYNLIWKEWFRSEDLQNSPKIDKGDGPDDPADYPLRRRGKRHDYFTSCLPWPQKGPAVEYPVGGQAPITGIGTAVPGGTLFDRVDQVVGETDQQSKTYPFSIDSNAAAKLYFKGTAASGWPDLYADLDKATATGNTINALRQAFQIQKLLERDARGGTRYTEIILSHFGVSSPDMRLQRPEYLGGGRTPVMVSQVPQTSSTDQTTPQGNLAAYGTAYSEGHGFVKSFTEHCVVIGLISCQADLTYQQGLNRMFSRLNKYDFYWPALSHIGEQAVVNKEIYAQGSANPTQDDAVFGYQERYAEYRYKPPVITGKFRSTAAQTLDRWHLAQKFDNLPVLNDEFIQDNPPVDRVIAVNTEPHFLFDSYFTFNCARPMPVYSVPGLIDHF